MPRTPLDRILAAVSLACVGSFCIEATAQTQPKPLSSSTITLQPTTELADLLELVSQRLGVSLEYDRNELKKSVSLRLRDELSDDELWDVLVAVLDGQGFSIVQTEVTGLYRVVASAKAGGAAARHVMPGEEPAERAGFVSAIVRVRAGAAEEIAKAIAPLLTPQTGSAKVIGGGAGGLLLIADTRARVEQTLAVIALIDLPPEPASSFVVALSNITATQAGALLEQVFAAESAFAAGGSGGVAGASALRSSAVPRTIPLPGDDRLMVIAPASRADSLRTLIAELDARRPTVMRPYAVTGVAPTDLAVSLRAILEQGRAAGGGGGPAGSSAGGVTGARIYADAVTGAVFVTATEPDHARLDEFIARIAANPLATRRVLRAFTIRNRDAAELMTVLATLVDSSGGFADDRLGPRVLDASLTDRTQPASSPTTPTTPTPSGTEPETAGSPNQATSGTRGAVSTDPPALSLTVDGPTNTIIATGEAALIQQLESIVALLDRRQPQVMLDVVLVSLSEGDAFDLGVELRTQFERGETSVDLASLFGLGSGAGGFPLGTGFTGTVIRPGDFQVLVRAVESMNKGRTVALPRQLVQNNATATLRSVSRQPFTSINASDTVATTSFGGTEDAGVTLTLTPQIAAGDHLGLEYAIELSAFTGESTTIEGGGVIPPPSQQNSLQGQVTLPDGYTVVLGGLNSITDGKTTTRVPLLGAIPVLGALFGTQSDSTTESRFYVFVRPTVLRHESFEDLRLLSAPDIRASNIDDGEPTMTPLWID